MSPIALEFSLIEYFCQMAVGRSNLILLNPLFVLRFESSTSGIEGQNSTTTPTWQMIVKGVTVCSQQSMPNHLPVGSGN